MKIECVKKGQGGKVPKPHYDTEDYREYVRFQKADGLKKKHWKDLPKMWEEELRFRKDFENALANFVKSE